MRRRLIMFGLALIATTCRLAAAQTRYKITNLGNFIPAKINSKGQLAGSIAVNVPTRITFTHAAIWESGRIRDLGTLPAADESMATGINASGQMIGNVRDPSPDARHRIQRAFLWQKGIMQDLGALDGADCFAAAINDAGQVVGSSHHHAFLWQKGRLKDLGLLPGAQGSAAHGINSRGQVLGEFSSTSGGSGAFLWQDDRMRDLGKLDTGYGEGATGHAFNDRGQWVGSSTGGMHGESRPLLFSIDASNARPRKRDLGTLGGSMGSAASVNNRGRVVGFSRTARGVGHAFIWDPQTGMQDLNLLIAANSGWVLFYAVDINDGGQIVGHGVLHGKGANFLLTPTH